MTGPRGGREDAAKPTTADRAVLAPVADRARGYADLAKAPNTLRAYRADWRDIAAWCEGRGLPALPAGRPESRRRARGGQRSTTTS